MTQQQTVPSSRPGRMTAVMRAVAQPTGPKILRVGVVQHGKVVDERLIKQRTNVTIGPSEKAMFVVPARKLPPNFRLFELIGGEYYLNFLSGMSGRVALKTGISELAALKTQAKKVSVGKFNVYRVLLQEDSRGKVVVGDTTFLFQFVVPPPPQPRAQLPMSVQAGAFGDIDWFTTIVAAFSFLIHFFFVALVYSDWMDPIVDDDRVVLQLVESVRNLPPPPIIEQKQAATDDTEATATATSDAAEKAPSTTAARPSGGTGRAGAAAPGGGGDAKASQDARADSLAAKLAAVNVLAIGTEGGDSPSIGTVLDRGEVPTSDIDAIAQSQTGTGSGRSAGLDLSGGPGSGAVTPGAGSGKDIGEIGDRSGTATGTAAAAAGTAKAVKGPQGSAIVGGAGVSGGSVANASSVVARMRGRFRNCYQSGLNSNPELQGAVTLVARIGPNGEVQGVSGGGGSLGAIVPCLMAVVQSAQFSPPDGGGAVVSIPINFVRQE